MKQPVQRSVSSFVLAHLSDPHLTGLDSIRWPQLLNKRMSGYLSWQRRRRHIHTPDRLALLVRDLQQQAPDHIAVTGDLTQLGTPAECTTALQWLQALGSPERVSVVPGNHDTYVQAPWSATVGLWRDYMEGVDRDGFPFLLVGPESISALPGCGGCLAGIDLSAMVAYGTPSLTVSVPADPTLLQFRLAFQGLSLLQAGGCPATLAGFQFALSDTLTIQVL